MAGTMRVLITGMSGTGKSAIVRELVARGHRAYDLDSPEWSHWIDVSPLDALTPGDGKDWVWREDRVAALLSAPADGFLFVSGCAENMVGLYVLIDRVILLSAPVEILMARLAQRSSGGYGHHVEERRKVLELIATVEPLLRDAADHEIDSSGLVASTVDRLLHLVRERSLPATLSHRPRPA